jgi:hypothetical protein
MSTPPSSPNVSPDDPSQTTLLGQYNELMQVDDQQDQPKGTGAKPGEKEDQSKTDT